MFNVLSKIFTLALLTTAFNGCGEQALTLVEENKPSVQPEAEPMPLDDDASTPEPEDNVEDAPEAELGWVASVLDCAWVDNDACSDPHALRPLDRVYLQVQNNGTNVLAESTQVKWEVVAYPAGANPNDFGWENQDTSVSSFWMPLAGQYEVRATVLFINENNEEEQKDLELELDAVPGSKLHVQLVWDDEWTDQDLHMVHTSAGGSLCDEGDCFYSEKKPVWFADFPAGEGPNPRLDRDDTNGMGPENINVDYPNPGTYTIYAHYFPWHAEDALASLTLRIYIDGELSYEAQRDLEQQSQFWHIARVTWMSSGDEASQVLIEDYPINDDTNEVGMVDLQNIEGCSTL